MNWLCFRGLWLGMATVLVAALSGRAEDSVATLADQVNPKMVKLFGSGGFQGLASYGSGVLVSPEGYVLTVASHMLLTQDLRVHLYDGRRFQAKVLVVEPELDVALVKIDKVEDLPYFDIAKAAKAPMAQAGDWILAFSNQFQIATRDEPMSVQRGVIAAFSKLHGRRGIFEAPYTGDVYVLDAITNNPGAGGGVIVTRKGELLGIIGKELRNTLTETWINYAVPIQVLASFVEKAKKGEWKPIVKEKPTGGQGNDQGIGLVLANGFALVANVVERTPPFIEEIIPGSPAARAGLKADDLIVYLDGEQVGSIKAFQELVARARVGTVLRLEVRRVEKETGGSDRLVAVEMKLEPARTAAPKPPPKKP